jgi:hypothetical protein
MIPTVEQVKVRACGLLGDAEQDTFTHEVLREPFSSAYEELAAEFLANHLPRFKLIVLYTLPASTTELTPDTALITNFGELDTLEERPSGSSESFVPVSEVDQLSQVPAQSRLIQFVWRNDRFYFIGATGATQLRITYYDSGAAPETGTIAVDGCLNFLAYRTAAIAGPPKGYAEIASDYDKQARGPYLDNRGGFMQQLIAPIILAQQRVQHQQPAFEAGGNRILGGQPPFYN